LQLIVLIYKQEDNHYVKILSLLKNGYVEVARCMQQIEVLKNPFHNGTTRISLIFLT
jgi:hypothetical protein